MKKILTLNAISPAAQNCLIPPYCFQSEAEDACGVLVRSYDMHHYALPNSVLAVARAGAGVNNIPVAEYAERGVVVFNTPGANANAVKELVITALLLSSRKILDGARWVEGLKGDPDLKKRVEKEKSAFVGPELIGKKLGVVGMGAIGALVAGAALSLGMEVVGYDPYLSVESAWRISRHVQRETDFSHLLEACDYVTLHLPYTGENKGLIGEAELAKMKSGAALINLARGELVDSAAVLSAIESGKLARYVTDFPSEELIGVKNVIALPHLGASTPEAEENCAVMATKQLMDYLENGNIGSSVNYPACAMPRSGACRVTVLHKNQKSMISGITAALAEDNRNIENFVNKSKGEYACSLIDLDGKPSESSVKKLQALSGVIRVRVIE